MKNSVLTLFKIKNFIILMLFVPLFYACEDDDNNETDPDLNNQDEEFVMDIGHVNVAEIELGTLAASKATDESVQDFAEKMVTDHTKAQNELKAIADEKGVSVPDEPDDAHKALKDQLEGLEGYKFDSAYISSQVTGHELAQDILEKEIDEGEYDPLEDYASKTLETVNMHFEMAKDIKDQLREPR